jgi:hypothetical protein
MFKGLCAIAPPLFIAILGLALTPDFFVFGLALCAFGLLDARGRYRDYKYLARFTWLPARIIEYYGRSYCGRHVVVTLFPVYGFYYRQVGYKWWHFLPDDFPQSIMHRRFWRNLFSGQRY